MSLSANEKNLLLKVARDTLLAHLAKKPLPPLPRPIGRLGEKAGAFVTLHKGDQLRGCIGNMVGQGPLVNTIQEMAIESSTHDPRFPPVTLDELLDISIEISVLSPLKKIKKVDEIEVGKHGIIMTHGWNRGVLLPQVATENNWDRETFLINTCHKAGLPPDAWKNPQTVIEIFSAEVFGEKDFF